MVQYVTLDLSGLIEVDVSEAVKINGKAMDSVFLPISLLRCRVTIIMISI